MIASHCAGMPAPCIDSRQLPAKHIGAYLAPWAEIRAGCAYTRLHQLYSLETGADWTDGTVSGRWGLQSAQATSTFITSPRCNQHSRSRNLSRTASAGGADGATNGSGASDPAHEVPKAPWGPATASLSVRARRALPQARALARDAHSQTRQDDHNAILRSGCMQTYYYYCTLSKVKDLL